MSAANSKEEPLAWVYPKEDDNFKKKIIKEFKINPVTAQILVSRGFTSLEEIHHFLYAKLPDLHDPFLIKDMMKAAKRVVKAIKKGERVLIYGDNDVDGMTGTALLMDFLQFMGVSVFSYISTRGVTRDNLIIEALPYAKERDCTLVITVDCGVTSAQEIRQLMNQGVDVIVTDHHEPTEMLPDCVATLNPKLADSNYPNRELTGVGVAFKLAHGVTNLMASKPHPKRVDLKRYLDLVALGTVADMGVLLGENRILVRYGLIQLHKTKRVGLAQLVSVCDLDLQEVTASDIVFKIAPRLNSLGRIDDPQKGVRLLLIRNSREAEKMAVELNLNNTERQKIERTMSIEVESIIQNEPKFFNHRALVLSSDTWHPGVIAIISTRLTKQYNRPSCLIAIDGHIGKGSLRSIPQFPLLPALKQCRDLLQNFGGHDLASGLTIETKNIPEFTTRFRELANQQLQAEDITNKLYLDAQVAFKDLTFEFLESNKLLEPYGNENLPPVLFSQAKQAWPPKVIGKTHLKMFLEQEERILEGIAMNRAGERAALKEKKGLFEVAFTPQLNLFQKDSIQLLVKDYK